MYSWVLVGLLLVALGEPAAPGVVLLEDQSLFEGESPHDAGYQGLKGVSGFQGARLWSGRKSSSGIVPKSWENKASLQNLFTREHLGEGAEIGAKPDKAGDDDNQFSMLANALEAKIDRLKDSVLKVTKQVTKAEDEEIKAREEAEAMREKMKTMVPEQEFLDADKKLKKLKEEEDEWRTRAESDPLAPKIRELEGKIHTLKLKATEAMQQRNETLQAELRNQEQNLQATKHNTAKKYYVDAAQVLRWKKEIANSQDELKDLRARQKELKKNMKAESKALEAEEKQAVDQLKEEDVKKLSNEKINEKGIEQKIEWERQVAEKAIAKEEKERRAMSAALKENAALKKAVQEERAELENVEQTEKMEEVKDAAKLSRLKVSQAVQHEKEKESTEHVLHLLERSIPDSDAEPVVQSVNFKTLDPKKYSGNVKSAYEKGYAIAIGACVSPCKHFKKGVDVTSQIRGSSSSDKSSAAVVEFTTKVLVPGLPALKKPNPKADALVSSIQAVDAVAGSVAVSSVGAATPAEQFYVTREETEVKKMPAGPEKEQREKELKVRVQKVKAKKSLKKAVMAIKKQAAEVSKMPDGPKKELKEAELTVKAKKIASEHSLALKAAAKEAEDLEEEEALKERVDRANEKLETEKKIEALDVERAKHKAAIPGEASEAKLEGLVRKAQDQEELVLRQKVKDDEAIKALGAKLQEENEHEKSIFSREKAQASKFKGMLQKMTQSLDNRMGARERVKELQQTLESETNQVNQLKAQSQKAGDEVKSLRKENKKLTSQTEKYKEKIGHAQYRTALSKQEVQVLTKQLEKLRHQHRQLKEDLKSTATSDVAESKAKLSKRKFQAELQATQEAAQQVQTMKARSELLEAKLSRLQLRADKFKHEVHNEIENGKRDASALRARWSTKVIKEESQHAETLMKMKHQMELEDLSAAREKQQTKNKIKDSKKSEERAKAQAQNSKLKADYAMNVVGQEKVQGDVTHNYMKNMREIRIKYYKNFKKEFKAEVKRMKQEISDFKTHKKHAEAIEEMLDLKEQIRQARMNAKRRSKKLKSHITVDHSNPHNPQDTGRRYGALDIGTLLTSSLHKVQQGAAHITKGEYRDRVSRVVSAVADTVMKRENLAAEAVDAKYGSDIGASGTVPHPDMGEVKVHTRGRVDNVEGNAFLVPDNHA